MERRKTGRYEDNGKPGRGRTTRQREDKPSGGQRSSGRPGDEKKSRPYAPKGNTDRRGKPVYPAKSRIPSRKTEREKEELIRLNKFIANSGVCSRREADKLILAGVVRVNGKVVTELGMKVSPADKIQYEEQTISLEKPRYILLNKPKGFITTMDDPEKRKTVMSLIRDACRERVYPVGRLDRNTTGLLLFTNDGTLAKKLTHPRYGIRKIYHVELDRPLARADFEKIKAGPQLEEGPVQVDNIEYIENSRSKKELGIELHSGQNRVVRRIFEQLEYDVVKLDRVSYAGLTKKNLPRGRWRFLEDHEINMLKMTT